MSIKSLKIKILFLAIIIASLASCNKNAHIPEESGLKLLSQRTALSLSILGTRDPLASPFSSGSIWNMPIGSGAVYVSASLNYTAQNPRVYVCGDEDYWYVNSAAAPFKTMNLPGRWPNMTCKGGGFNGTVQIDDNVVVSNGLNGPGNKAAALLKTNGRTLEQIQPIGRCTAAGTVYGYRLTDADIYGPGTYGGHAGSGLSSIGGTIRLNELLNDTVSIKHALKIEIDAGRLFGNYPAWPAERIDRHAAGGGYGGTNSALRMGSLLAILPAVTEQSLGITTVAGKKMFHAMQDYGAYIVDETGGPSELTFCVEKGLKEQFQSTYGYPFSDFQLSVTNAFTTDIGKIFNALYSISNNSAATVGGGGTPRRPLADAYVPPAQATPIANTGWVATASLNSGTAINTLDGNTATYWTTNSNQAAGQYFQLDMLSSKTFSRVDIAGKYGVEPYVSNFPQDYRIAISPNASTWTDILTGAGSSDVSISFAPATARYIRIYIQGANFTWAQPWSISEVSVYP